MTNRSKTLGVAKPFAFKRILVFGGTGTIGRATVRELARQGHHVVCFVRPGAGVEDRSKYFEQTSLREKPVEVRLGDVTNDASLKQYGFRGEKFDVVVSCLASRNGCPDDAWQVDYRAHMNILRLAKSSGVSQLVLLSAICLQKPRLPFQFAKLAFEKSLIESGLNYSIVRPTAYFKSLSGQINRVKKGKPFIMFGDGALTACKPISDNDLARYLAGCVTQPERLNKILPVGGPGKAISPKEQGEYLFRLSGQRPRFRRMPVAFLDVAIFTLGALGKFIPRFAEKKEFAKIGRYYATESMLLLNSETGEYDADATPAFGTETLYDFYKMEIENSSNVDRGQHAVFE